MVDSHLGYADDVARSVLETLDQLGIPWVVLSSPLSGGGDFDVVTNQSGSNVVAELRTLSPFPVAIMTVEYDIGGSEAIWFANTDGSVISHIDFLADADGQGRLAIPVGQILATAEGHHPSPAWQATYVVSKRVAKGDWERLASFDDTQWNIDEVSLSAVFGPRSHIVTELIDRRATADEWASNGKRLKRAMWRQRAKRTQFGSFGLVTAITKRYVRRILHPVAPWIHVSGTASEAMASELASLLGKTIRRTRLRPIRGPGFLQYASDTTFRLRPGLLVTYGRPPVIATGFIELRTDLGSVDAVIRRAIRLLGKGVDAW